MARGQPILYYKTRSSASMYESNRKKMLSRIIRPSKMAVTTRRLRKIRRRKGSDLDKEDEIIKQFECDTVETVSELQRQEVQRKTDRVKKDEKILFDRLGFSKEGDEDDRY
ncbi:hypothetical protein PTTG_07471 [Puccinia triticina 1-1 BBBD Race 1]|uniref:Uncharacterized protein n=1 Tax=Puccinia triticina (isolate 1-1 / race 1 (BBBD)) TaxID=630390 RepID=A0A180G2A9_PUCT1|nr:hypothetical protein PTTG_07471 [Puccinia triticina 1-1 BBBD Race 1]